MLEYFGRVGTQKWLNRGCVMHREHHSWIKGAIPLVVSCSYIVVLFIEPCFSIGYGSINRVHPTAGSSKSVHKKSGSLKLVHQKSGSSLQSVHWKSCLGYVHSPNIKFASGRARQADVAPAVLKWRFLIVLYLYKSDYLHKKFLFCVCAARTDT